MPITIAIARVALGSGVMLFTLAFLHLPGMEIAVWGVIVSVALFPLAFLLELAGVFKALLGE